MERIGEYFGISFWKFGKNFRKFGKSLEKIGKSLGEIPVSASDNMNSSRDIHYFSRMQHPLIWKNIYPCSNQYSLFAEEAKLIIYFESWSRKDQDWLPPDQYEKGVLSTRLQFPRLIWIRDDYFLTFCSQQRKQKGQAKIDYKWELKMFLRISDRVLSMLKPLHEENLTKSLISKLNCLLN